MFRTVHTYRTSRELRFMTDGVNLTRFVVAGGDAGVTYDLSTFDSYSKPHITISQAMATAGLFAAYSH